MILVNVDELSELVGEPIEVFLGRLDLKLPSIIDAEPVRHGRWIYHIDDTFPFESTQECSVCHEHEYITLCHENYCPNCGADMRGD